jgi:sigma-B regulation protein RsbQ
MRSSKFSTRDLRNSIFNAVAIIGFILFSSCSAPKQSKEELKVTSPLHYSLTGQSNKTLVFIHGWCINGSYWDHQVNQFNPQYRVLTLDLAGHGQSKVNRTRWTIEAYADDVVELIRELKLDSIILVAHSMSGNIALHIYSKIPERIIGFVGVDNLHELGLDRTREELEQANAYFEQMKDDFPNQSKEYALKNLFSATTPDSVKNRVINDFGNADPAMAVSTLQSLILEGENEKLLAPQLKVPMLLVLSNNGKIPLTNEPSLNKYCGAGHRIFTVKGTGHYPMVEAPEEFDRQLEAALNSITAK